LIDSTSWNANLSAWNVSVLLRASSAASVKEVIAWTAYALKGSV